MPVLRRSPHKMPRRSPRENKGKNPKRQHYYTRAEDRRESLVNHEGTPGKTLSASQGGGGCSLVSPDYDGGPPNLGMF